MAASRAATRAEDGHQRMRREIVTPLEQRSQEEGYAHDPNVMTTIK